jgi:transposase
MPVRYDQDTKAKAIRLVLEHAGDYPSEYAAITAVARRLGMTPETLRKWIRQAAVDEGQAAGVRASPPGPDRKCGDLSRACWTGPVPVAVIGPGQGTVRVIRPWRWLSGGRGALRSAGCGS